MITFNDIREDSYYLTNYPDSSKNLGVVPGNFVCKILSKNTGNQNMHVLMSYVLDVPGKGGEAGISNCPMATLSRLSYVSDDLWIDETFFRAPLTIREEAKGDAVYEFRMALSQIMMAGLKEVLIFDPKVALPIA